MSGMLLERLESGRFVLGDLEIHCGDRIEIFASARMTGGVVAENVWLVGRVEHDGHGYYFTNSGGPSFPLVAGMTARWCA